MIFIPQLTNNEFALCIVCLGRVNKATMAYKTNDEPNGTIRSDIRNLVKTNKDNQICIPKNKNETRTTYEIADEIEKEIKNELSIDK